MSGYGTSCGLGRKNSLSLVNFPNRRKPPRGPNEGDLSSKVGRLEGQMEHVATKANVWQALFVGIIAVAGVAIALFKWMVEPFFQSFQALFEQLINKL